MFWSFWPKAGTAGQLGDCTNDLKQGAADNDIYGLYHSAYARPMSPGQACGPIAAINQLALVASVYYSLGTLPVPEND